MADNTLMICGKEQWQWMRQIGTTGKSGGVMKSCQALGDIIEEWWARFRLRS